MMICLGLYVAPSQAVETLCKCSASLHTPLNRPLIHPLRSSAHFTHHERCFYHAGTYICIARFLCKIASHLPTPKNSRFSNANSNCEPLLLLFLLLLFLLPSPYLFPSHRTDTGLPSVHIHLSSRQSTSSCECSLHARMLFF
jgi:hypothetical protein